MADTESLAAPLDTEPGAATATATEGLQDPQRRRSPRACDRCHRNASRCTPGIVGITCSRCKELDVQCTYTRPIKRRGPQTRRARQAIEAQRRAAATDGVVAVEPTVVVRPEPSVTLMSPVVHDDDDDIGLSHPSPLPLAMDMDIVVEPEVIEALVDVFYHTIYPIRPYFHWPTFHAQVQQQLYRSDWGIFVVTMALCSLTAGRLYNGVQLPPTLASVQPNATVLSSQFYNAAVKAMPNNISGITDYVHAMKAHALLASVCIQNSDLKTAIAHLGDYTSASLMHSFHVEASWPPDLTEIQRQERRRLYWAVYQADQFICTNFNIPCRQREGKSTVQYPAEVIDDTDVTETRVYIHPDRTSFLLGFNYCTDLYRLAENIDGMVRARHQSAFSEEVGRPSSLIAFLSTIRTPKDFTSDGLYLISKLYGDLPKKLKTIKALTADPQVDRYGLTAANVILTTHNLKMRLLALEKSSVHSCCAIASELLDELSAVPPQFFNTSSTSSLYLLAHVGHMLGSFIQNPISTWTYLQVRNILLVLADFLERIETNRGSAPTLASKLRAQVHRINQCMQHKSHRAENTGLESMGQGLLDESINGDDRERADRSNEQQELPTPSRPVAAGVGALMQEATPTTSGLTRVLGIGDTISYETVQQQQRPPSSTGPLFGSQGIGFNNIFDISQQLVGPNPAPNFVFPMDQGPLLPTDFFDGWPILS